MCAFVIYKEIWASSCYFTLSNTMLPFCRPFFYYLLYSSLTEAHFILVASCFSSRLFSFHFHDIIYDAFLFATTSYIIDIGRATPFLMGHSLRHRQYRRAAARHYDAVTPRVRRTLTCSIINTYRRRSTFSFFDDFTLMARCRRISAEHGQVQRLSFMIQSYHHTPASSLAGCRRSTARSSAIR